MILTDAGIHCLTEGRDTLISWLRSVVGIDYPMHQFAFHREQPCSINNPNRSVDLIQPTVTIAETATGSTDFNGCAENTALTPEEQRARVVALRGFSQAREGEYDTAQTTFVDAIHLDPRLDLSRLPSFWSLPRQTHDAVIAALYETERSRDAASLIADLRTRYRPRLLPSRRAK